MFKSEQEWKIISFNDILTDYPLPSPDQNIDSSPARHGIFIFFFTGDFGVCFLIFLCFSSFYLLLLEYWKAWLDTKIYKLHKNKRFFDVLL